MPKSLFYTLYMIAGGILSFFIPENGRYLLGFGFSLLAGWAYRVIRKEVPNG